MAEDAALSSYIRYVRTRRDWPWWRAALRWLRRAEGAVKDSRRVTDVSAWPFTRCTVFSVRQRIPLWEKRMTKQALNASYSEAPRYIKLIRDHTRARRCSVCVLNTRPSKTAPLWSWSMIVSIRGLKWSVTSTVPRVWRSKLSYLDRTLISWFDELTPFDILCVSIQNK